MIEKKAVRWWWVRHGPTHETAFTGWRDVPADLSDSKALARLNAYLPADALLISSDLIRAVATADALAGGRQRLPDAPGLREFHFGAWDGRHFADVAAESPDLSQAYWGDPGDAAPPGGESWNAAAARVDRIVATLSRAHPGRDIVAVAHFGVILTRVQAADGSAAAEAIRRKIAPLSVTRVTLGPGGARLGVVNHQP